MTRASTGDTIHGVLGADHARLDALLRAACDDGGVVDPAPYAAFRRGLLRHIAIEEKLLLPAASDAGAPIPAEMAGRLRLDHGAIAALLVPTPTAAVVANLARILALHNPIEEGEGGLYDLCDARLGDRSASLLAAIAAYPEVRVSAHNDGPNVMSAVARALERAGYRFQE